MNSQTKRQLTICFVLYYAVLAGLTTAAFVIGRYWWGLSVFAYVDGIVRFVILALAAVIPIGLALKYKKESQLESGISRSSTKVILGTAITVLAAGGLFWLFRAQAFYLGDGYTLLSTLASDNPFIKYREIGESMAHLWLKQTLGSGEQAALLSFQIISIATGVISIVALIIASVRLFETTRQRLLFVLGVSTGGHMLLFFGYVENYSLLVSATLIYGLVGLLGATGKISRWWAVVPLLVAILMHVLAVVLVPSGLYLLLGPTIIGHTLSRMTRLSKTALAIIVFAVSATVFLYLYNTTLFFQLAFVPLMANRFTIDGYTLFSLIHLSDVGNLVFVLAPALVVILPALWVRRKVEASSKRAVWFLLLMVLGGLGAAFMFDPKLGMPRDWDLFSFAGVPIALLLFYMALAVRTKRPYMVAIASLAVVLNLLVLVPRVITQTNRPQAVEQFRQYIYWDHQRNQNALGLLVEYHQDTGDSDRAVEESQQWHNAFPAWGINHHGLQLANVGQYDAAIMEYRRVIQLNPVFPVAYGNIGAALLELKKYDSALAYLEIARGMNPYNPRVAYNYGSALFFLQNYDVAEAAWLEALTIDSTIRGAWLGLAQLSKTQGRRNKYFEYLSQAVSYGDAPVAPLKELGLFYLQQGDYHRASELFDEALKKGLNVNFMDSLRLRFPQLRR
ncbi:MAG: tetratricopeptide repeat protein [candidate division Zixibacteria bacterium]|nr:tetratricopeptide repeat protein [candidate division Zixibacteria bacterium]